MSSNEQLIEMLNDVKKDLRIRLNNLGKNFQKRLEVLEDENLTKEELVEKIKKIALSPLDEQYFSKPSSSEDRGS